MWRATWANNFTKKTVRTTIPARSRMLPTRVPVSGHVGRTVAVTEPGAVWAKELDAVGVPVSAVMTVPWVMSVPCVMTVPSGISMVVTVADADA